MILIGRWPVREVLLYIQNNSFLLDYTFDLLLTTLVLATAVRVLADYTSDLLLTTLVLATAVRVQVGNGNPVEDLSHRIHCEVSLVPLPPTVVRVVEIFYISIGKIKMQCI